MTHPRTAAPLRIAGRNAIVAAVLVTVGCAAGGSPTARVPAASPAAPSVVGAWRLLETASRPAGSVGEWEVRPVPQGGLYVFAARHYSYFYIPVPTPRPRFADGNRPTDPERAATFATFIAGAGTYSYDGRVLRLRADFRKNPNEMTGELWHWELDAARGDTLRFIFREPPFMPGREWRTTLVRAE